MADNAKIVSCILSTFVLCSAAIAIGADSGNPYQGIVDRNVFGLKPPPPPGKPEDKKADLPPITLTGITTILGNKRALMNVQAPGKQLQSFILAEGQREGEIEVLEIDEKAGSVKVNHSGTILPLTFEKNGAKLPAATPPSVNPLAGAAPPVPYVPGAPIPVSNGLRPIPQIPQRQLRVTQPGGPPVPGGGGGFQRQRSLQ